MAVKYFAYGSNMSPTVMTRVCPTHKVLGAAKLIDQRLAFTRRSAESRSGVADIVPAPSMAVWGVVYEVDEKEMSSLDEKEGVGFAYARQKIEVVLATKRMERAITYSVMSKESKEVPPSPEYLGLLLDGARHHKLPPSYIYFLETLRRENRSRFRRNFLVFPTDIRVEARGMNILKISKSVAKRLKVRRFAAVAYGDKVCFAKVAYLETLDEHSCQLDQSIRHSLGIRGRECYGATVVIHPVTAKRLIFPFVSPRSLVCSLYRPVWADSEKNICVLHSNSIRLLGLRQGEYVRLQLVRLSEKGEYCVVTCTLRVFAGTRPTIKDGRQKTKDYPKVGRIYLDLDARRFLGIPREIQDIPVIVSPDIGKLFRSRLLYYGIALFLGITALSPVVQEVMSSWGLSRIVSFGGTLLLALALTLVLCLFDIRGRVQY